MTNDATLRIALIGASGWLGRSIGPSILKKGIVTPEALTCINRSGPSQSYAEWPDLTWTSNLSAGIDAADLVILSVRPDQFLDMQLVCQGKMVLSVMAGVSCAELSDRTGARAVVRCMPNAVVEIERSYSPWFATGPLTDADRALIHAVLTAIGTTDALDTEGQLDVITALSGAGPAYPALLAAALFRAGTDAGLPALIAANAAEAVVCSASRLLTGQIDQAEALVQ
jgi:pyrroline-5-carboxylate reductase